MVPVPGSPETKESAGALDAGREVVTAAARPKAVSGGQGSGSDRSPSPWDEVTGFALLTHPFRSAALRYTPYTPLRSAALRFTPPT